MRWHIGTAHHETHVAQGARVDHRFEVAAVDGVELAAVRLVDQIEQARETVAQIETAATAMTNVEYPAQLGVELLRIVKIRIFIVDGMAHWRLETAFHGTPAGPPAPGLEHDVIKWSRFDQAPAARG